MWLSIISRESCLSRGIIGFHFLRWVCRRRRCRDRVIRLCLKISVDRFSCGRRWVIGCEFGSDSGSTSEFGCSSRGGLYGPGGSRNCMFFLAFALA